MLADPLLDAADIQGHVLIGFGGGYQRLVGCRFRPGPTGAAKAALSRWADRVTPSEAANAARALRRTAKLAGAPRPDTGRLYVAMSLSAAGLERIAAGAGPDDPVFRAGAAADAVSLHDEVDERGRPVGWIVGGTPGTTPHVFIVLAADAEATVLAGEAELLRDIAGALDVVYRDSGRRLGRDIEHFGFVDGIAQPGPRGTLDGMTPLTRRVHAPDHPLADRYARPGQPLVWPGQFVFGYPTQRADSPDPGQPAGGGDPALRNGSIMVFRRLRQDVAAFEAGMEELAAAFAAQGLAVDANTAAAWCVGRWPDGTPLSLSPHGPNSEISQGFYRRDGFLFDAELSAAELDGPYGPETFPGAAADPSGFACPFFAHIRQVNPRDHPVDQGSSGVTLRSQMLRRGIPYGPDWPGSDDGADRGLLFMSYQTSVESQFHRLMKLWVNNPQAPPPGHGIDPLIGSPAPPAKERPLDRRPDPATRYKVLLGGRWVITTGAGYFFAPGIGALKRMLAA